MQSFATKELLRDECTNGGGGEKWKESKRGGEREKEKEGEREFSLNQGEDV